jgi:hypothetical protein
MEELLLSVRQSFCAVVPRFTSCSSMGEDQQGSGKRRKDGEMPHGGVPTSGNAVMPPIFTLNVTAAHANLRPLLGDACWEGHIVAVFQTSLLLAGPQGLLLHLHGGPQLVSPFSLRTASTLAGVLQQLSLGPGLSLRKTGRGLEISGHFHLWLGQVGYYHSPRPRFVRIDPKAIEVAQRTQDTYGCQGGIHALPQADATATAMRQALAHGNLQRLGSVARRLVGLGPGLTPSGDDFLVGWLRGLWLAAGESVASRVALRSLRRSLLPDLAQRTTPVGAAFIRYGLAGEFAEVLDQAAAALSSPSSPPAVADRLRQLMAQGETSGTDTTAGLLSCLEALSQQPHRPQEGSCPSGTSSAGAYITTPSH